MASARIQRWALTCGAYDYTIAYTPGKMLPQCDSLSRLPLPCQDTEADTSTPGELVMLLEKLQHSPVKASDIKTWTDRDPILSRVRNWVQRSWSGDVTDNETYRPYTSRKNELSVLDGCLLWGSRVVVPKVGRTRVLQELHAGHPGIQQMKRVARGIVWWPGLDLDIETEVKECVQCDSRQSAPSRVPLHPWE